MALFFARDFLRGSNMDERKQYWDKELATLAVAANKTQLEAFAQAHGQILNCYQNYNHEDRCDFDDTQSYGGTESKPMLYQLSLK